MAEKLSAAMIKGLEYFATCEVDPDFLNLGAPNTTTCAALVGRDLVTAGYHREDVVGYHHDLTDKGRATAAKLFPFYAQWRDTAPVEWNGRTFGELTEAERFRAAKQAANQLTADLAEHPIVLEPKMITPNGAIERGQRCPVCEQTVPQQATDENVRDHRMGLCILGDVTDPVEPERTDADIARDEQEREHDAARADEAAEQAAQQQRDAEARQPGLRCTLLVPADGSCANGGLSNRTEVRDVILQDPALAGMTADMKRRGQFPVRLWEPTQDCPAVRLAQTTPGYIVARPVERPAGAVGPMASGAYIVSHDDRFAKLTGGERPIPLHDRFETPEQYRALSSD